MTKQLPYPKKRIPKRSVNSCVYGEEDAIIDVMIGRRSVVESVVF